MIDTKLVMSMLSVEEFVQWHNEPHDDVCMDIDDESGRQAVSDEEIMSLVLALTGCCDAADFVRLSDYQQMECAKELQSAGASIRQIARVTGGGKGRVERWLKQ